MDWSPIRFNVGIGQMFLLPHRGMFLKEIVMVTNTKRFQRFPLLHYRVVQALLALSNPNKTIRKPLVKGQAAGQLQLIDAHWPPDGFHRNSVPARFTFDFEMDWVADFELHLMVQIVSREEGSDDFVLGLVSHDQWYKLREELPVQAEKVDIQERWVGVKYSAIRRGLGGDVFLSRKLHDFLIRTSLT